MTQVCTRKLPSLIFPRRTAIFPSGPYLSTYDTVRRTLEGWLKKLRHSDSFHRLPLRLNWLVLLTSLKALASTPSLTRLNVTAASVDLRKSSAEPVVKIIE